MFWFKIQVYSWMLLRATAVFSPVMGDEDHVTGLYWGAQHSDELHANLKTHILVHASERSTLSFQTCIMKPKEDSVVSGARQINVYMFKPCNIATVKKKTFFLDFMLFCFLWRQILPAEFKAFLYYYSWFYCELSSFSLTLFPLVNIGQQM